MSAAPGELAEGAATEDDVFFEAPALLRILWADPQHMAEHIAVWSLARFGPRAEAAVEKLRAADPALERDQLEQRVVERQTRVATTEGAFVGGPFIVLIVVAFCAALLAQAQMVYELAAVAGLDADDRMRAAELLVLLGAYGSREEAAVALEEMTHDPRVRDGKRLPRGTRIDMIRRMAYLLQVIATDDTRGRFRVAIGWVGISVLFLVGLVLPLVWVPYMAYSMRRSTLRMGARALAYYAAEETSDAGVTVRQPPIIRIGGLAAFARTAVLVVLPIVAAVIGLLTGFSLGGDHLVGAGLLLLVVSALATLAWFGFRWWRHRRRVR